MKLLLVQSWLGRKDDLIIYPIGLAGLATILEQYGHEVRIFDPNTAQAPLEDTRRAVQEFAPHLVGLSFRNIDNQLRIKPFYYYNGMRQTLAAIREACGQTPVAIGGPAFSMMPDVIMQRNPGLDFGLYLEAEESFPELLNNLDSPEKVQGLYYRDAAKDLRFTGPRPLPDFADLPFPRRHFLDLEPYKHNNLESVGVQTKRGCPLTCAYCVYPHLNGRRWRLRTPESVVQEIEYLRSEFGVRRITFADSIVNLPYDYSTKIFTQLKEANLGMEWLGYMHVQGVTKDYLQLCMDSGCSALIFSPDGLSQGALAGLKKNLTTQDIRELKALLDTDTAFARLRVEWCFFVNPPGETLAGLLQVLWFFLRSKQFFRERTRNAFINWIRLEPASDVYKTALEQGVVTQDTDLLPDDESLLPATFYSNPRLRWLDPPVMAMLRAPKLARKVLRSLKP